MAIARGRVMSGPCPAGEPAGGAVKAGALLNLPNLITIARILLVPVMVWAIASQQMLVAFLLFLGAGLSDAVDGFLAKRFGMTSELGAYLDPVADKLMVTGALLVLVHLGRVHPIFAFVIIGREITISALREWMAQIGASKSVAVSSLGKIKTTAQMIAIPMLLYYDTLWGVDTIFWGDVLLLIAALLTVWSMLYYLRKAWPLIKKMQ